MARIKLELPDVAPIYTTIIPIRITDINYGNHLGNDAVLSIVHESRVRMLHNFGYSELDIGGCGIIMADASIIFKNEGHYGYDLKIDILLGDISRMGFELYYLITNDKSGQTQEIARVKTGIVCFDYKSRQVVRIPQEFEKILKDHIGNSH